MEIQDNMKSPASPQEWYEAGVLLRKQERFGDAINAFRTAADLSAERIASLCGISDFVFPETESVPGSEGIEELEKIKASSLAFIELIDEIRSFVNKDLLNP